MCSQTFLCCTRDEHITFPLQLQTLTNLHYPTEQLHWSASKVQINPSRKRMMYQEIAANNCIKNCIANPILIRVLCTLSFSVVLPFQTLQHGNSFLLPKLVETYNWKMILHPSHLQLLWGTGYGLQIHHFEETWSGHQNLIYQPRASWHQKPASPAPEKQTNN